MNNFWAAGLALVHKHLPHHSQGHHAFLTLLHCKIFERHYQGASCCAMMVSCAELLEQAFTTIMPQILELMSHRTWQPITVCLEHNSAYEDPHDVQ